VVPESLCGKPELSGILRGLDLPEDFDLFALENLLPTHRRCNLSKGTDIFDPADARFYLHKTKTLAQHVRNLVSAKRQEPKKDILLAAVGEAVRAGMIAPMDLQAPLDPNVLRLSKPLLFADEPDKLVNTISSDMVERCLDRPVLIGGNPKFTADFGDGTGARMSVRTCRQYRAAMAAGFYPITNYDIKSEAFLKAANSVLTAASSLRTAHISYIRNPHRGVADLDLFPASVLPAWGPDERELVEGWKDLSLDDLLERNEIKISRVSSTQLSLERHSMGLMIRELCRSDVDGDGIEDILCECYCWAIDGTLGFGWTCILSLTDEKGKFKVSRP
jgi:hypothetical protein